MIPDLFVSMVLKSAFIVMLLVAVVFSCGRRRRGGGGGGGSGPNTCTCNCNCRRKRDVATIPANFSYYDADKSGEITKCEFAEILNMKEKEAQEYFEIIDHGEDGKINLDEFQRIKKLRHVIHEALPRVKSIRDAFH